ncbi:phospholipase D-like domain-containing protein [Haloglomus salinum]|uniref:phospholipase D-like domain-containing protein n=1 Tax=Haloglomus salinum TaxID=2962673 RepID=UPI0020C9DE12|nr:phospholipase D-like domain-containing protein [Haloglomus salinum]
MPDDISRFDRALAIADILDHDEHLVQEVEGHLLVAAGRSETISPAIIARETSLEREEASDLFRQLDEQGAVLRDSYQAPVVETNYRVRASSVRAAFDTVRNAVATIAAYQDRVPRAEVTPLVTFPDDPSFDATTPAEFGMEGLMSTLVSAVKDSSEEIVLLSPFFEQTGFGRLADVLLDALGRGVELTVVTRYLGDSSSHNHSVIQDFVTRARERGVAKGLKTVDYTVWADDVPASDRNQEGENPAFTLHAKVMVFDRTSAYVGSANVTDYGFGRYLELGVLLGGPPVKQVSELCNFLLESDAATTVSL